MSHATFYRVVLRGPAREHVRIADLYHGKRKDRRGTKYYHAGDLHAWMTKISLRKKTDGGRPA